MKSVKLLQAAETECTNKEFVIRMCECVRNRLLDLQTRAMFYPTSANEEKAGEWGEIAEVADDIMEKYKRNEIDEDLEDMIAEMKDKILDYDMNYQGISRLVI